MTKIPAGYLEGGKYVLEIQKQLWDRDLEATPKRVLLILEIIDNHKGILNGELSEIIQFALFLYITWMQENDISLKTKEDALTELEFLKTRPDDVSKGRFFDFLREVVSAEGPKMLSSQLKLSEEEISKALSNNGWVKWMSDTLYDALKRFIEASYLE